MLTTPTRSISDTDAAGPRSDVILSVRDLRTQFFTRDGVVRAVDGISFDLVRGETLCIVGESGCGKSVTALSILGLVTQGAGRIVGGSIKFEGVELTALTEREMRRIRGNRISMIFQEPMTSLNPVLTVGDQIAETLQLHQDLGRRTAWNARSRCCDRAHSRAGATRRRVSAPAVRRHAPARHDRDGPCLQPASSSSPTSRPPRSTSRSRRRS